MRRQKGILGELSVGEQISRTRNSTVSLNTCVIGQWFGDMKSAAKATVLTLEETSLVCINASAIAAAIRINASAIAAAKTSLLSSALPARNHADSAEYFKELLIGTESIGSGTFGEVSFVASGHFFMSKRSGAGVHLLSSVRAIACNQMCQQRSDGWSSSRQPGNCCAA